MTDDPIKDLRDELTRAARRRTEHQPAPRRRISGRALALVCVVLATAVPALGAATGVISLGSGRTPDGSTFTISRRTHPPSGGKPLKADASGEVCQDVGVRKEGRDVVHVSACAPAGTHRLDPLIAGFIVAPPKSRIVTGTVGPTVAKVTISGVSEPVVLRLIEGVDRRFFVAVAGIEKLSITAYDAKGNKLKTTTF